jgi:K+-sensing histidine kinase KdpD
VKIPAIDLESRVLLVAAAAVLLAVLRMAHLVQIPDSSDIGLLLVFAILLANFIASSRHAAAATALSFLSFELLCWTNPQAGNSILAIAFHNALLAFFGLGFALYAFGAVYAWLRPGSKAEPVRRTLQMVQSLPVRELSGVTVESAR